jgi:hypothetical protein
MEAVVSWLNSHVTCPLVQAKVNDESDILAVSTTPEEGPAETVEFRTNLR